MAKRKITRRKGNRFCTLEVELREDHLSRPVLSICGVEGEILKRNAAKKHSLSYWESYFEDQPGEIQSMNKRFNKRFTSARGAAKFVIATDGEFHGLDVVSEDDKEVMICNSCGQIRDSLADFFPEAIPFFQYHLNNCNAGCTHQKALGWGYKRDIALTAFDCTTVQLDILNADLAAKVAKKRAKWIDSKLASTPAVTLLKAAGIDPTNYAMEALASVGPLTSIFLENGSKFVDTFTRKLRKQVLATMQKMAQDVIPDETFKSWIFEDSLCAPCPECGYKYGTAWLYEPLPQNVIDWVNSL
jgi:hypothetical protein